jgi:hypothetical protein
VSVPSTSDNKIEILIYKDGFSDEKLIGSISCDEAETIQAVKQQINDEMDDIPSDFSLYKAVGDSSVIINKKQYTKPITSILSNPKKIMIKNGISS